MNVSDAQRLKALEAENGKLKRLLAKSMLELDARREPFSQYTTLKVGLSSALVFRWS